MQALPLPRLLKLSLRDLQVLPTDVSMSSSNQQRLGRDSAGDNGTANAQYPNACRSGSNEQAAFALHKLAFKQGRQALK